MAVLLNIFLPPVIAGVLAWYAFEPGWHVALYFFLAWAITGTANGILQKLERVESKISK